MNNKTYGIVSCPIARHPLKTFFQAPGIAGLFLSAIVLCPGALAQTAPSSMPSLYDRLGGMPVIEKVIGRMVDLAAADIRVRHTFDGVSLRALKEGVTSHLCEATGGPCEYEGGSIKDAHAHLGITAAQFSVVEQYFIQALDEARVRPEAKQDVLRLLSPMKQDIVSK